MHGVDFVKDTYIPIFTNKPGDYKEWRQRILLYKRKSDLNKKQRGNHQLDDIPQWHRLEADRGNR